MKHPPLDQRLHKLALCHSRSVDPCVFDFIAHNMSEQAAYAALRAMPVNPPRPHAADR